MASPRALLLTVSAPTRFDRALLEAAQLQAPSLTRRKLKDVLNQLATVSLQVEESGRRLQVNASFPLGPGVYRLDQPELLNLLEEAAQTPTARPAPSGCFLEVVFEDEGLLVLHKPSGVPSLPLHPDETGTAVNAALAHFPSLLAVGRGGLEPGLLHRLDTLTSGLLAFAKTPLAYSHLRELWSSGEVRKIYTARVSASPKRTPLLLGEGLRIDHPLCADPQSKKKMRTYSQALAAQGAQRLEALTEILELHEVGPGCFDLLIRITTGVRHQIRCHLASLGWPILGDPLYGGAPVIEGNPRLYLHSTELYLPGRPPIRCPPPWDRT